MPPKPPVLIAIDPDDYHARHVGHLKDGRQFFVTTPFVPATESDPGKEFIAVYLFDPDGTMVETRISDLGPRSELDQTHAAQIFEHEIAELGEIVSARIRVRPFEVELRGTYFGLIPRPPESDDEGGEWWVEAQPGNFMAFHEPWDSGEYDT